jgi:phosphate transport system permease protein
VSSVSQAVLQPTRAPDEVDIDLTELERADVPRRPVDRPTAGDRVYRAIATGAALVSLIVILLTFYMLQDGARDALRITGIWNFFTDSAWNASNGKLGVFGLIVGTFLVSIIALGVAVPMALAMALFINEYSPARVKVVLTSVVDLLAALPSLVYGMWGFYALQPRLVPVSRWVSEHFSFIPIFRLSKQGSNADTIVPLFSSSAFTAGVVVGIMVLPIITSVTRDVMAQCPRDQCEAALGLGGTRWGMVRDVLFPFARSGIVGASLLGLGRALGETIAVALIISPIVVANWHVLESGTGSIAPHIAIKFGEATELERSGLLAAGLALFAITFVVNLVASRIVNRPRFAK